MLSSIVKVHIFIFFPQTNSNKQELMLGLTRIWVPSNITNFIGLTTSSYGFHITYAIVARKLSHHIASGS